MGGIEDERQTDSDVEVTVDDGRGVSRGGLGVALAIGDGSVGAVGMAAAQAATQTAVRTIATMADSFARR